MILTKYIIPNAMRSPLPVAIDWAKIPEVPLTLTLTLIGLGQNSRGATYVLLLE